MTTSQKERKEKEKSSKRITQLTTYEAVAKRRSLIDLIIIDINERSSVTDPKFWRSPTSPVKRCRIPRGRYDISLRETWSFATGDV
jgi:hypothetical protein